MGHVFFNLHSGGITQVCAKWMGWVMCFLATTFSNTVPNSPPPLPRHPSHTLFDQSLFMAMAFQRKSFVTTLKQPSSYLIYVQSTFIPISRELETHLVRAFGVIFFFISSNEFFLESNFFIRYSSLCPLSKRK